MNTKITKLMELIYFEEGASKMLSVSLGFESMITHYQILKSKTLASQPLYLLPYSHKTIKPQIFNGSLAYSPPKP